MAKPTTDEILDRARDEVTRLGYNYALGVAEPFIPVKLLAETFAAGYLAALKRIEEAKGG